MNVILGAALLSVTMDWEGLKMSTNTNFTDAPPPYSCRHHNKMFTRRVYKMIWFL